MNHRSNILTSESCELPLILPYSIFILMHKTINKERKDVITHGCHCDKRSMSCTGSRIHSDCCSSDYWMVIDVAVVADGTMMPSKIVTDEFDQRRWWWWKGTCWAAGWRHGWRHAKVGQGIGAAVDSIEAVVALAARYCCWMMMERLMVWRSVRSVTMLSSWLG